MKATPPIDNIHPSSPSVPTFSSTDSTEDQNNINFPSVPLVAPPVTTISPPLNQNTIIPPTRKSSRNRNKPARFRVSSAN